MSKLLIIGVTLIVAVSVAVGIISVIFLMPGLASGGGAPLQFNYTAFKFEDVGLNFSFDMPAGWAQSRNGGVFSFVGPAFTFQNKLNISTKLETEYFESASSATAVANTIMARHAALPDYQAGSIRNVSIKGANNSTINTVAFSFSFSRELLVGNLTINVPMKRQAFVLVANSSPFYAVTLEALAPEFNRVASAIDRAQSTIKSGPGLPPPPPPPPQVCTNTCASGYTQKAYPDCACVPPPLPNGMATLPVYHERLEVYSFDKAKVESSRFGGITGDGSIRYNEGKELEATTYGIHPLGEVDFDSLVSWDKVLLRNVAQAKINNVYIVRTNSQKWAKIKVISAVSDSVTFQWVYNPADQGGSTISFQP
ncbi:hypothetical protein HY546_02750 [archaeon]|nr:hypothetical protein [archaeon]